MDRFLETYPKASHVAMDPVQFVRRYDETVDREIVGFVAAAFAYGNVKSVLKTVEGIVSRMGPRPSQFIAAFDPRRDARVFKGFQHRWNSQTDLVVLLWILRRLIEDHGSLEVAFASGALPDESSVEEALERFAARALGLGHERFYSKQDLANRRGVRYFFPRPSGGSACKRLNLFLRWMVRSDDGVDCGVWVQVTTRQLLIPLDTHIARIAGYLGLTSMRTSGWKMATDITEGLRRLDAEDPVRYDFALCHLGIAGDCPRKRDPVKCVRCPIVGVCQL